MTSESSYISEVTADWPYLLGLLERLVNINSFSDNREGCNAVQDILQSEFAAIGMQVERRPFTETGDTLIARAGPGSNGATLLVGHVDTVHPPDSPFRSFTMSGNRANGPGVLDMKGGLVVMLGALRALHSRGQLSNCALTAIINSDEEIASFRSEPIFGELAKECARAFVFEWGRSNNGLITRRSGMYQASLMVHGRAAHSGNAHHKGVNAIVELAQKVPWLAELTDHAQSLTLNVGLIHGGTAINVVPDYAEASIQVRAPAKRLLEETRTRVQEIAAQRAHPEARVELLDRRMVSPMERHREIDQLLQGVFAAGKENGITFTELPTVVGGLSNANTTSGLSLPTLDGFGPMGDGAHTNDEHVQLDSFIPRSAAIAAALTRL